MTKAADRKKPNRQPGLLDHPADTDPTPHVRLADDHDTLSGGVGLGHRRHRSGHQDGLDYGRTSCTGTENASASRGATRERWHASGSRSTQKRTGRLAALTYTSANRFGLKPERHSRSYAETNAGPSRARSRFATPDAASAIRCASRTPSLGANSFACVYPIPADSSDACSRVALAKAYADPRIPRRARMSMNRSAPASLSASIKVRSLNPYAPIVSTRSIMRLPRRFRSRADTSCGLSSPRQREHPVRRSAGQVLPAG